MMAAFNDDRDHVDAARHRLGGARAAVGGVLGARHAIAARSRSTAAHATAIGRPACSPSWCCPPMAKPSAELHLMPGRKVIGRTPGQRSADRQQVHQPPSLPARHRQRWHDACIEDLNSTNGILVRGKRVRRHHAARRRRGQPSASTRSLYVDEHCGAPPRPTRTTTCRASDDAEADAANEEAADDDSVEDAARAR